MDTVVFLGKFFFFNILYNYVQHAIPYHDHDKESATVVGLLLIKLTSANLFQSIYKLALVRIMYGRPATVIFPLSFSKLRCLFRKYIRIFVMIAVYQLIFVTIVYCVLYSQNIFISYIYLVVYIFRLVSDSLIPFINCIRNRVFALVSPHFFR